MDKREFTLELGLDNSRSNTIFIKEKEVNIGYATMVYDSSSKIYDGILVLHHHLDEHHIFKIGKMIQDEFVASDEEMFIETYFGISFGMICDERPDTWNKILNS